MTYDELKKLLDTHRKLARNQSAVFGYADNEPLGDTEKFLQLRSQYEKFHTWFNNFLNSVDDLYIKNLLYKRFQRGYSWVRIALSEGGMASDECYRKIVERYLHEVAPSLAPYGEKA